MNRGQLTSLTYCDYCGLLIEIYPNQKDVVCKHCSINNNLEFNFSVINGQKINEDQFNSSFIPNYWSNNIMSVKDKVVKKKLKKE